MKSYSVTGIKIFREQKTITINADSAKEAHQRARKALANGDFGGNFEALGVEYSVIVHIPAEEKG